MKNLILTFVVQPQFVSVCHSEEPFPRFYLEATAEEMTRDDKTELKSLVDDDNCALDCEDEKSLRWRYFRGYMTSSKYRHAKSVAAYLKVPINEKIDWSQLKV